MHEQQSLRHKFPAYVCFLLCTSFLLLIVGCTDYKQLKTDLMSAISKQEQMKSYQFQGSIELKADASLLAGSTSPFSAALFAFLKDSKIDYSGMTALEPAQMEAAFNITPTGSAPVNIPVLIKDSKLFFRIPALNKDDEYMMLPIANKQVTGTSHSGAAISNLTAQLLNGMNPEWLLNSKDPVKLADGTAARKITIEINTKNEQAFNEYWSQSIAGLIETMKSNSLLASSEAAVWQQVMKQVQFHNPTSLSFLIDEQGFIREQNWQLSFSANGSTRINQLNWQQTLSDLNKTPVFTKEIPVKQKSLEDLLKLIKPPAANK